MNSYIMKKVKINIQDIVIINSDIPGSILLKFEAPYHEEKEIIIPKGTLLLFLRKYEPSGENGDSEMENSFIFDFLVNYQLLYIIDKYEIKPLENEMYFMKYALSINESTLLNNFETVIPFDYKYLTPEIEDHLNFVANEYQNNKIYKNRTILPQSILKRFFNNKFIIEKLREDYSLGFITSLEVKLRIVDLMKDYYYKRKNKR